jgi:hypothetical protein
MYVTLHSSTCFEHQHAHLQEDKLYYHSIWYRHSLYSTVQYAGWEQSAEQSATIRHIVQPLVNEINLYYDARSKKTSKNYLSISRSLFFTIHRIVLFSEVYTRNWDDLWPLPSVLHAQITSRFLTIVLSRLDSLSGSRPPQHWGLDITLRRATLGRTFLD